MKRFFEKHDLIKIAGIMVLISAILTWIIPYGYYTGSEMVIEDITRIGITNFMQYGLLGIYYFTILVTFLFVLGGFYQVLSKTKGYQNLVKIISRKLRKREIPFVLIVSFILAALCGITKEYFPLLVFIPFIITIMNKAKIDKISAFTTTFGSLLVGTIGNTYSANIAGIINSTFSTEVTTSLAFKIILFVAAYVLMNLFTVLRLRKKTSKDTAIEEYDRFEVETLKVVRPDIKTWPYIVMLSLIFVVTILAFLPWESWNVTLWSTISTWVGELSLFGVPIVSYLLGEVIAFGSWDLFTLQYVLIFATLLVHWFGKVSFDEILESYGEGFKKMGPVILVFLAVYLILEISVMYPVMPVIVDWLATLTKGFNAVFGFLSAFITSIFGVEMQYVISLAGTYYAYEFAENAKLMAIIFQAAYGFAGFFVPSSAILMLGLSYLNIPYKEWMKHIWKFLLAMFGIIAIIILIMAL